MPDTEPPRLPTKEEIALLPPFERLERPQISVVAHADDVNAAMQAIAHHSVLGFDTESRPTFLKGEVSEGPHVVQFAAMDHAWVFQLHEAACRDAVASLLGDPQVHKTGFGLAGDRTQIQAKFGQPAQGVHDLDQAFQRMGYRKSVGVKTAIALIFNRRFAKSKRMSTSNWANRQLNDQQVLYAANDAWAARRVHAALEAMPRAEGKR